ncbi:MAG: bifunctional phosphoribosylaminoimidazolecarboxamide formyltransferase/IMP cyclohydrolase [Bacteriovoracia bacterium]
MKIRRALFTCTDKTGIAPLALAMREQGAEIVATGKTAEILKQAGIPITPIEKVSGSPEAFQGRMKTLSFPVCSGILYRRGDAVDEADLKKLGISPIDCVVVNFYPFEKAVASGATGAKLVDEIDIGGPTLVRSAAKNSPHTLVLTHPSQYEGVIVQLKRDGEVGDATCARAAAAAWDMILAYDAAIAWEMGGQRRHALRYGENPHQRGWLEVDADSPIAWPAGGGQEAALTPNELSYNNILDLSAAFDLACELKQIHGDGYTGVVIIKHNNPCGVAWVPKSGAPGDAQMRALELAWAGDPVSAFGGVLLFTDPLSATVAPFFKERFVELIAAPELRAGQGVLAQLLSARKNLKAVRIERFVNTAVRLSTTVPGGRLVQTPDAGGAGPGGEALRSVTEKAFPPAKSQLAAFGGAICRVVKSNSIVIVAEAPGGAFQLVGAGQGQPNRIDSLKILAVPRALSVLGQSGRALDDCVMVSDAFFPFRDTVDEAHRCGLRYIVQPGGSMKDKDSVQACNEHGMAMAFTGVRHFRH